MKFVVGNWKCNPGSLKEARSLLNEINDDLKKCDEVKTIICPPFVFIPESGEFNFDLGAQNCFWEEEGSYTGEVSASMLKDVGCKYVIIGHSERRKYFNENSDVINKKLKLCLGSNLIPILCIDKIDQIETDLKDLDGEKVLIAYEPISAIGSGEPLSLDEAEEVNSKIKGLLGDSQIVLYGGSVDKENIIDFLNAGFDGVLVGGKSLDSEEFVSMIKKVKDEI